MAASYEFLSPLELEEHYEKHGDDFRNADSMWDYLRLANEFILEGCNEPRRCCPRADGDTIMYEAATKRFAIVSHQWTIVRTFHVRERKDAMQLFRSYCVDD